MSWSLGDLGPSWRKIVNDGIWEKMPKTWLRRYDPDVRRCIDQLLSRLIDGMTEGGEVSSTECGKDGVIVLSHMDTSSLIGRGDRRYGSDTMAEFLESHPDLDLVPMVCGLRGGKVLVLDGHHRMRAYSMAGRKALVIAGIIVNGSGSVKFSAAP